MASGLKLLSAQVKVPTSDERAAQGPAVRMTVTVEVQNQDTKPLHMWASPRGYDYDAATKVLTLHLSEQPFVLPPGIIMISDHPRAPDQVEVPAGARISVPVPMPAVIRRAAPNGTGWVEEPIGEVDHVNVDVQFAPKPIQPPKPHETAPDFRARIANHGTVARASLRASPARSASRRKE